MSSLSVHILNSIDELRGIKDQWNDLWERSSTTRPTARAEFLIEWLDRWAPDSTMRTVVVEHSGKLVAVLPLIARRWMKWLQVGSLPRDDWYSAGNLLLDEKHAPEHSVNLLVKTLDKLPWSIFRLPLIPSNESAWQKFHHALQVIDRPPLCRPSYDVSYIPIDSDWNTFARSCPKSHRKQLARAKSRLDEQGGIHYRRYVPRSLDEAEPLMRKAFEIEDSGWKGRAGTSILRVPRMQKLFETFGGFLAERGELEIAFLEVGNEPIAFEYLWNAKGTMASCKVGYTEKYKKLMPGNVLMDELLRDLFESRCCEIYDCFGPVSVASAKWRGSTYHVSQWTIGTRKPLGRAVMFGYQQWVRRGTRPLDLVRGDESLNTSDVLHAESANSRAASGGE